MLDAKPETGGLVDGLMMVWERTCCGDGDDEDDQRLLPLVKDAIRLLGS